MIRTDGEMQQNLECIDDMYRAIAELRRRVAPLSYQNFLTMAEGSIEQIRRLRNEIDEYLGIQESFMSGDEHHPPIAAP